MEIKAGRSGATVEYRTEYGGNAWAWGELSTHGSVTISRTFEFLPTDLINPPSQADLDDIENYTYLFRLGRRDGEYIHIQGRIFDIPNDVRIAIEGINWSRKIFTAERNVSIFRRLAKVLGPDHDIIVGGEDKDAIPVELFRQLLARFPNSGELDRYASARVAAVLEDQLDPQHDFRAKYEEYLAKRSPVARDQPLDAPELYESEIAKYQLIIDTIKTWLSEGDARDEAAWQAMILRFLPLIFPKYVAVLQNVHIEDRYTKPDTITPRYIDLALVDVNGNIDVVEIKRPFDNVLLGRRLYRNNSVPTRDLSGTIMQAEKYLFHLNKWGVAGEDKLTSRYADKLPAGMRIRITNPKALLILGRDRRPDGSMAFSGEQALDLEVIKRKYANMMDVLTYDDLLRRLENVIRSLQSKSFAVKLDDLADLQR